MSKMKQAKELIKSKKQELEVAESVVLVAEADLKQAFQKLEQQRQEFITENYVEHFECQGFGSNELTIESNYMTWENAQIEVENRRHADIAYIKIQSKDKSHDYKSVSLHVDDLIDLRDHLNDILAVVDQTPVEGGSEV